MSAHDLTAALAPSQAEEPGRASRRTAARPGAVTAEQVRVIEAKSNLTIAEAQIITGRSAESIRLKIRSGELPAYRWGRRVFIKRADLDALLDSLPSARGAA